MFAEKCRWQNVFYHIIGGERATFLRLSLRIEQSRLPTKGSGFVAACFIMNENQKPMKKKQKNELFSYPKPIDKPVGM